MFLQNKLVRSRKKLEELQSVLSVKRQNGFPIDANLLTHSGPGNEVEKYTNLIASYSVDNTLGNIDDAVNVLNTVCRGNVFMTNNILP